jgi:hypothetical protein
MQKINEAEIVAADGHRLKYGRDSLSYSTGASYVTIPIEHLGDPYEMRIHLSKASPWLEKGKPSAEGHPDATWLRARVSEALNFLGRRHSFDM